MSLQVGHVEQRHSDTRQDTKRRLSDGRSRAHHDGDPYDWNSKERTEGNGGHGGGGADGDPCPEPSAPDKVTAPQ